MLRSHAGSDAVASFRRPIGRRSRTRARPRLPRLRLRFRTPADVLWRLGETLNRGWFLTARRRGVEKGASVEVEFALPGAGAPVRTRGRILAIVDEEARREGRALVAFEALGATSKRRIDEIVQAYRSPHALAPTRSPGEPPLASRRLTNA